MGVSPRTKITLHACLTTSKKDNNLLTLSIIQNYEKLF